MEIFDRNDPMFDEKMDIHLNEIGKNLKNVSFRILRGFKNSNILRFEITDDDALDSFLYALQVSESEFQMLKMEQNLYVDFHTFPVHVMELLQCCLFTQKSSSTLSESNPEASSASYSSNASYASGRPKNQMPQGYTLRLNTNTHCVEFCESNRFKQLVHLSLKFKIGDDTMMKEYVKERLVQLLEKVRELKSRLEKQSGELGQWETSYYEKEEYIRTLENQKEHDENVILKEWTEKYMKCKEESMEMQEVLKQKIGVLEKKGQREVEGVKEELNETIDKLKLELEEVKDIGKKRMEERDKAVKERVDMEKVLKECQGKEEKWKSERKNMHLVMEDQVDGIEVW